MSSTRPSAHNWSQKPNTEEEEEDPFDQRILRSGCANFHYALLECMSEHKDWRKCQQQVQSFKDCMSNHQRQRAEELQKRYQTPS